MPNIEIRALDLSRPDTPLAFPFPNGSLPIALSELHYIWVRTRAVHYSPSRTKIVRMNLRFRVDDGQLVLCDPLPKVVRQINADLQRSVLDVPRPIVWRATMIHNPNGIGRITASELSIDDSIEVSVFELGDERQIAPRVALGVITKIFPIRV